MLLGAIFAAALAVGVIASLWTGSTILLQQWRMPQIVRRRKNPGDFWFMVILLGLVAGFFAIETAIRDLAALLWPTLATAALGAGAALFPKPASRDSERVRRPQPARPVAKAKAGLEHKHQASVAVRGWSEEELQRILDDFSDSYELSDGWVELEPRADGISTLTFPIEIAPQTLCFLVNYLNYPKGLDLAERSIGVVAHATLSQAFNPPDATLVGKTARIYVPSNDTDYDVVCVHCETKVYVVSFANFVWRPIADTREPATVSGLRSPPV